MIQQHDFPVIQWKWILEQIIFSFLMFQKLCHILLCFIFGLLVSCISCFSSWYISTIFVLFSYWNFPISKDNLFEINPMIWGEVGIISVVRWRDWDWLMLFLFIIMDGRPYNIIHNIRYSSKSLYISTSCKAGSSGILLGRLAFTH